MLSAAVALLPVLASIAVPYFLYRNHYSLSRNSIHCIMVAWVMAWTLKYWILGPYSYMRFYDEADIAISRYLHDIYHHKGGTFLHGIQGGGDFYSSQGFGGQYISLERLLFTVFPLWIALLIHKLAVVCCSFLGSYCLLRKTTKIDRFYAFFFGAFISIFNPYAFISSVQHGIGYAVVPLGIYVLVCRTDTKNYLTGAILLSLLVASSTSPTHSFVVLLAGVVLFTLLFPVANYSKFAIALSIMLVSVVLNWSEVLYGMSTYGLLSARVVTGSESKPISELLWGGVGYFWGKTDYYLYGYGFSPATLLSALTLVLGFYYRTKISGKIAVNVAVAVYTSSLVYILSSLSQMSFLNSVNFDRICYYIVIPICLLAAHITEVQKSTLARVLPFLFLGFSVLFLVQNNIDAALAIFNGNQLRITSVTNLKKKAWEPGELYRAVSVGPYAGFHPNFSWAYGIETLDGYTSLIPKGMVDFWHYGIHKNEFTAHDPPFIGGNMYITYTESAPHAAQTEFPPKVPINIDAIVDVNLLKLANVGYLFSYFPVTGRDLVKVSGPDDAYYDASAQKDYSYYESKLRHHVFEAPDIPIFRIDGYSRRAYFPGKLVYLEEGLSLSQTFRFISANYEPNIGFTSNRDLESGLGEVIIFEEIADGYRGEVEVTKPGVFILNTYPLPYWQASVDGQSVPAFAISEVQLGINLPVGKHKLEFRYDRPLLRDKLLSSFGW